MSEAPTKPSSFHPTIPDVGQLLISNQLTEMSRAGKWLADNAARLEFTEAVRCSLELVLDEALSNAIKYAFDDNTAHSIVVRLKTTHTDVQLEIEDDGKSFNPLDVPPPLSAKNPDEAKIGGLGIHLIRNYTDECRYLRIDGKNLLTLTIRQPHLKTPD